MAALVLRWWVSTAWGMNAISSASFPATTAPSCGDAPVVLKRGKVGRVRTPRGRREALLDEFERSGLGGTAFARLAGVNYQTFAGWMQKRRRERGQVARLPAGGHVRLVEAVVGRPAHTAAQTGALRVELPGGAIVPVADETQVRLAAQLLKALEGVRSC